MKTTTTKTETNLLNNFDNVLNYQINLNEDTVKNLEESRFNEYNLEWKAKDLIIAKTKLNLFENMYWDIHNDNSINCDTLNTYLLGKMRQYISLAKTYKPTSTCLWKNAVSVAQNEAVLDVIQMIERYIKF